MAAAVAASMSSARLASAASQTWVANPTDAKWITAANWSGAAVPGNLNPTAGTLSLDVVTFNNPIGVNGFGGAASPLIVDNTRDVQSILFDTANVGAYAIGAVGDTTNQLWLTQGGNITMNATVANSEVFNIGVQLRLPSSTNGAYSFINNAVSTANTLSFKGNVYNNSANTRPMVITLGGTNTGNNVISAFIDNTNGTASSAGAYVINKTGVGTWIIQGASDMTQKTSAGVVAGCSVTGGILALQNGAALGGATGITAPNFKVSGTGILRLDGIALGNTGVTLDTTGTIQANGTSSVNSIPLASSATNVSLMTTNAADIFTVGVGGGVVSGGGALTVIHTSGPGEVLLGSANTYAGLWSLDSGTTTLGNSTGFGPAATAAVAFGAGSTAIMQLNSNSTTLAKLNTNATPGSAVIENGGASPATLTVSSSAANTYAGILRDGTGGGSLSLLKSGTGVFTISGNNTYSGNTTVSNGTLLVTNTAGSGTGTGNVNVNNLATLAGTGTIAGTAIVNSGGTISPGSSGVGTMTVGGLTLNSGSSLNFDVNSTSSLDHIQVSNTNGLTINGGQLTINDPFTQFSTDGVYNLIGYSGAIGGTGLSALTLNPNNESLATNTYQLGTAGGFVTLTVADSGGTISYWNTDSDGTWSAGPWTTPTPNGVSAFASFGGAGGTPITAPRTITVDGAYTVGVISLNNANFGYTLAAGAGGSLTLDNNTAPSFITDGAGSHAIQVPLNMTANGAAFTVSRAADVLTVSGVISGTGSVLSKAGVGKLALTGNNTYTGGTVLNVGTIQINSPTSLGDQGGALTFNGGTLQLLADVTTARNYQVKGAADVLVDTNGHVLTQSGTISPVSGGVGGIVKNGTGTFVVQGTNSFIGATTINAGTLSITSNANLGDPATGAAVNLNGGTLAATGIFSLDNAGANGRPIVTGTGGNIDVAPGSNLTVSGIVSGSTAVTQTNTGTLTLTNTNNTGAITVASGGTLTAGNGTTLTNGGLGTGTITLKQGSTINSLATGTATWSFGNPLVVPAGETGTLVAPATTPTLPNAMDWVGSVTGAGTVNFNTPTEVVFLDNNFTGFTGTLNLTGSGNVELRLNGGSFNATGLSTATLNLSDTANLLAGTNSNGNSYTIGNLTNSSPNAKIIGGTAGGPTYIVGGLNLNSNFSGQVTGNTALTKAGTGILTLSNTSNTYTGATTVNQGILNAPANGTLGQTATVVVNATGTSATAADAATLNSTNAIPAAANVTVSSTSATAIGTINDLDTTPVTFGSLAGVGAGRLIFNYSSPGTFSVGNTTSTSFAGVISEAPGTSAVSLVKNGTGTQILAGANTYSGGTTINAGTLQIGSGTATGATNGSIIGPVVNNANFGFGSATNQTIGNLISGPGTASVVGGATAIITPNPANTYTGTTTFISGTLSTAVLGPAGSPSGLGQSTANLVFNGTTNSGGLQYVGVPAVTLDRGYILQGNGTIDSSGGVLTVPGPIVGTAITGTRTLTLTGTNTGANTVTGTIANGIAPSVTALTKAGTGSWTIPTANNYVGNTAVTGGILKIGDNASLGIGGTMGVGVTVGTTTVTSGTLDLNGKSVTEPIVLGGGTLGNSAATTASVVAGGVAGTSFVAAGTGATLSPSAIPTVTFTGGGGSGAAAQIGLGLTLPSVTISSGGGAYLVNDILNVVGGGGINAQYKVTTIDGGGGITGLSLVSGGTGYTSLPTGLSDPSNPNADGSAVFTFNDNTFTPTTITTTASGTGYTSAPTVGLSSGTIAGTAVLSSVVLTAATTSSIGSTAGDISIPLVVSGTGALTKIGTDTVTLSAVNTYTGATTVSAGTLSLPVGASLATASLTVSATGTANVNGGLTATPAVAASGGTVNFGANAGTGILARKVGAVTFTSGGLVSIANPAVHTNRSVLVANSLGFAGTTGAWAGKLDLSGNDLIIHNTTAALATATATATADQLKQGFNLANSGFWNGSAGIVSSAAANDGTHLTTLGTIINNDGTGATIYGTFDGQTVTNTDVLVKYTYFGDADLSGKVDGTDYSKIDNGFNNHLTSWFNGDFNYDGVVDGSDYSLIDNAFNTQGAGLGGGTSFAATASSMVAGTASEVGSSAVPEPGSLSLLGIGAVSLLARRRRKA